MCNSVSHENDPQRKPNAVTRRRKKRRRDCRDRARMAVLIRRRRDPARKLWAIILGVVLSFALSTTPPPLIFRSRRLPDGKRLQRSNHDATCQRLHFSTRQPDRIPGAPSDERDFQTLAERLEALVRDNHVRDRRPDHAPRRPRQIRRRLF